MKNETNLTELGALRETIASLTRGQDLLYEIGLPLEALDNVIWKLEQYRDAVVAQLPQEDA